MAAKCMMQDNSFWLNRRQVEEAECNYYAKLSGASTQSTELSGASTQSAAPSNQPSGGQSSLASEIAKAREQIKQSLKVSEGSGDNALLTRLIQVEEENRELRKVTSDLQAAMKGLEARIKSLETGSGKAAPAPAKPAAPAADSDDDSDDDDDLDLFGSDDEESKAEAEKLKQERIKAYAEKKAKKPQLIAKSNVILDIKPWDDETDMAEMERKVRTIVMDGLLWGASKLVPVGYGIKKLQIATVIVDDKVSTEDLEELIVAFEDFVQSVDIAAFNKI